LAIPASDFGGNTTEYYGGTKYGLGSGLNLHGKARVGVLGFRVAGEIDYSMFRNDGEAEPGQGTLKTSHNVLALKVGPEFNLGLPILPVTPYIGAHAALNMFSGETELQGVSRVPSGNFEMKSATRLGVGFSAGAIISLGPLTSLDLSATYDLMNVSGKAWEDRDPLKDERIDSYRSLNDEKDPLYRAGDDKHFIADARTINAFQVKATVMFGL
jgi:hypothetical protein